MKTRLAPLLVIQTLLAAPAFAEPCVGAAFDIPFPGAVDVSMHHADVPAAQFPGVWQTGMIEGQFYQIFANRLAVLQQDRSAPTWAINVDCQQRPCSITVDGNPPETALNTSKKLEQCLVPPEVKTAASKDGKKAPTNKAPSKGDPAKADPAKADPKKPDAKKPDPKKPDPKKPDPKKPDPEKATAKATVPEKDAPAKAVPAKPAPKAEGTVAAKADPGQKLAAKVDAVAKPATVIVANTGNVPLAGTSGNVALAPTVSSTTKLAPSGQATVVTGNAGTAITCLPPQTQKTQLVAVTCRSSVVPGSDPVTTLQKLLVLAGADPGDVDGLYGSKTKEAVLEVLGYQGRTMDVSEAINAVDAYLCSHQN